MIRLGGHGLPTGADDPVAFARAHVDFGYRAAYCPPVEIDDTDRLRAIETAFVDADVLLAEIGIWRNLLAIDDATRRANARLLEECFAKLGPHIVSCHAKDIILHHQAALHFDEVMIGDGVLDYATFLRLLAALPADVPLMLEHLEGPQYAVARDRLFAIAEEAGVAFLV